MFLKTLLWYCIYHILSNMHENNYSRIQKITEDLINIILHFLCSFFILLIIKFVTCSKVTNND